MRTLTKLLLALLLILSVLSAFYFFQEFRPTHGLPTPLRGPLGQSGQPLTVAGILAETNRHRQINNLAPLILNPTLNGAAEHKLADMFAQQYFDHDSPDGIGPSDVVDQVGYPYLRIGENLALGNFANDADLVQAWMDSPGHRANILSKGFTEIGLSASLGEFDGRSTWLAVQTFALPANTCPQPDAAIQQTFTEQRTSLNQLGEQLSDKKNELQQRQNRIDSLLEEALRLSRSGNNQVSRGNSIIKEGKDPQSPNETMVADTLYKRARQLQQDGEVLQQQAAAANQTAIQLNEEQAAELASYNSQVATYNELNDQLAVLADQLNQQINAYNDCANQYLD